jgi:hypothetical protein
MLLNNDIQIFFCSNDFTFSKGNKCNKVHYGNFKQNKFESFHLHKISIRYEFSNLCFCNFYNEIFEK